MAARSSWRASSSEKPKRLSPMRVGSPPGSSLWSIFEAGLARVLGRAQQLRAAHQRQLGLALRDLLGEAIDQVLGHVAPGMRVEELARRGGQPVGDRLGRIAAAAERRGEARADVGKEFQHRDGIDLAAKGRGADRGAGVGQREAGRLGAEGDVGAFAGRLAGRVGDLAAADEDGRTRIDHVAIAHVTSALISASLRPASCRTLLVCSPRSATFGPLCTGEPEKRKGGAGDL